MPFVHAPIVFTIAPESSQTVFTIERKSSPCIITEKVKLNYRFSPHSVPSMIFDRDIPFLLGL